MNTYNLNSKGPQEYQTTLVTPFLYLDSTAYIEILCAENEGGYLSLALLWTNIIFPQFEVISIAKLSQGSPRYFLPSFHDKQLLKKQET